LSTWLCSEPDRCKEECPEDSKRRVIGVGEAKHTHFRLDLSEAPVPVRSEDICNATETRAQSAVPPSTASTLECEYSARLSQVMNDKIFVCTGRVEPFQEPTCGACD